MSDEHEYDGQHATPTRQHDQTANSVSPPDPEFHGMMPISLLDWVSAS